MRQEMVVIGNEWNFGCCAERREFSIVRIFNEDKVVGIDTAGKLSLWPKEISELIPTEGRNSAQNKLGLAPGRYVPDQLKASLPDSREDTLRCASRVEARGYEDIRVDDNPFHSDFIHPKLAKVSRKILTELKPVHLSPQSAWGRSGTDHNAGPRTATRVGFTPTDLAGIASPVYVRCGLTVRLDGSSHPRKIVTRDEPVEPHPARHEKIEAHVRARAAVADQDAGAETSQHVYGKSKHGRHGRRL
jgi:hypothetical protein